MKTVVLLPASYLRWAIKVYGRFTVVLMFPVV
jgi:hypothetical protein